MTSPPTAPDVGTPVPSPQAGGDAPALPGWRRAVRAAAAGPGAAERLPGAEAPPAPGDGLPHPPGGAEGRWPAAAAVVAAAGLQMTLHARLSLGPHWLLPALEVLLLSALLAASPRRLERRSAALRSGGLTLAGLLSLANAASAALLVGELAHGSNGQRPDSLLLAGGALWAANVLIFALWYWELDRGGPADRCHTVRAYPDFLFPQMQQAGLAPPDWQPRFADYLHLSYTNAISFAASDVIPLTRWAKTMMMLQSAVSVAAIALVVARAVNGLR